jgi:hypothetical protein
VVDIFIEEVAAALGKLNEEGKCFVLGDESEFFEMGFEVAD